MLYRASSWYVFGLGLIILSAAASAPSQTGRFRMDYTVAITDVDSRLFHVTANVQNIRWRKGEEKELAVRFAHGDQLSTHRNNAAHSRAIQDSRRLVESCQVSSGNEPRMARISGGTRNQCHMWLNRI